ncbi:MAG: D-alanyl-D-alanine carboxypeptidase family protein [Pseudomonadota bacterium]
MNPIFPRVLGFFCLLISATAGAAPALIPNPPAIAGTAYLLLDYDSGRVLAEGNIDKRIEPASLTKMMSAYLVDREIVAGRVKLTDMARISEKAWRMEGSRMFVEVGDQVSVADLLKGIIVQSGNDSTVALAEHIAGSEDAFASMMNLEAQRLGMKDTHFVNSTGLPHPQHYTTARDLGTLARALIRDAGDHYEWYSIKEYTFNNIKQHNRNTLLWRDATVDGIKTGHTESAGYCLVASAKQDNMRLIGVVLGTKSENARADETQKLLTYGFRFFETHRLYRAGESLTKARIWKGETEELSLGLAEDLYVTIPRGQYSALKASMNLAASQIIAPVASGAVMGAVNVALDDQPVAARDLVALQEVKEGGVFRALIDTAKLWFE